MAMERGGLGIRNMKKVNLAIMAKLGWRFLTNKKDLWVCVLQGKYVKGNMEIHKLIRKQHSSNAWQSIVGSNVLRKGMKARVSNGKDTLFWRDSWLGDIPLLDIALKDLTLEESYTMVWHYWNEPNGWNLDSLYGKLPPHILAKLRSILVRANEEGKDNFCWGLFNDGRFSLKST